MTVQNDNKEYLKISEAAKLLGISQKTVYRWVVSGELAASRVGGLHLIRRADLDARLARGEIGTQTGAFSQSVSNVSQASPEPVLSSELTKCATCYQLIQGSNQLGGNCTLDDCAQPICANCFAKGVRYCLVHRPTTEQSFRAAEEKLQRGEFSLLVKGPDARQAELIFLNRIDARLSNIKSLVHPQSGELINIPAWDAARQSSDEQTRLLKLLNKLFLDSASLLRYPLNAANSYRLLPGKGQKGAPLEIVIQVCSRMERMVKQQFETEALDRESLSATLARYTEDLEREQIFRILVLASTSGWDASSRQLIQGSQPGSAYYQRRALVYLYDFKTGELIFDTADERTRGYAELFSPILPDEELLEVQRALEEEMLTRDSLALVDAFGIFPFKRGMLEAAFDRLAQTGGYSLVDLPQIGKALLRQD